MERPERTKKEVVRLEDEPGYELSPQKPKTRRAASKTANSTTRKSVGSVRPPPPPKGSTKSSTSNIIG